MWKYNGVIKSSYKDQSKRDNLFAMLDEYQHQGDDMTHPDMFMSYEDQTDTLLSSNPPDEDAPYPDQLIMALMAHNTVVAEETVEKAMEYDGLDIGNTTPASNTTRDAIDPITATSATLKEDEILITWGDKVLLRLYLNSSFWDENNHLGACCVQENTNYYMYSLLT